MIIPYQKLSPEALTGFIEDHIARHGTDSGYTGKTLQENIEEIKRQLNQGKVCIVFDQTSGTGNIVPKDSLKAS